MIDLTAHDRGSVLPVKAQPGARRTAILGVRDGALRVAVTATPDRGKANEAIADLLAESLDLRRSQVVLIAGPTARAKRFLIEGVAPESLRERLARALPAPTAD